MPQVSSVSPTNNPYIDGLLSGTKWAVANFTFSFPGDPALYEPNYGSGEPTNNFKAFTAIQQTAVRAILQMYSSGANINFAELTESATAIGDLRYGESDTPSTAWGYFPMSSAIGGDIWFNNTKHYYDNPIMGNYAYLSMMHETGHAMGLKHPQDSIGSFGAMPLDRDSVEYSVMSYRSYIGGPASTYTIAASNYPQTLMMYDIAALQAMYGADFNTNAGNTIYKWDPATGQEYIDGVGQGAPAGNKIFMTLWDGGGNDTYDFSNYTTSVKVSLEPGAWTTASAGQLAKLGGGHFASGNIANALLYQGNLASLIENVVGGGASDTLTGNQADNRLTGGGGNDLLDGVGGADIMVGGLGNDIFTVDNAGDQVIEYLNEGTDTVRSSIAYILGANVENLTLTGTLAINGAGNILNNTITGNAAVNILQGDAGNDVLDGGLGADIMFGGLGNDIFIVDSAGDQVIENLNEGTDTVNASLAYILGANVENLTLTGTLAINGAGNNLNNTITGNAAANVLFGDAGNDTLLGGAGDDQLLGGDGNDSLTGGAGADILIGGLGADRFIFAALGDFGFGAMLDEIFDFHSAEFDRIDLAGIDANTLLTGNQAFSFIGSIAFGNIAGQLCGATTAFGIVVSGDLNGDGIADFNFNVTAVASLASGDFFL